MEKSTTNLLSKIIDYENTIYNPGYNNMQYSGVYMNP